MSFIVDLARKPPKLEDITYFLRAILTRPGDIPGILRREAAKRRAGGAQEREGDPFGLRCLFRSWEAAAAADLFRAPPGAGAAVIVAPEDARAPLAIVTALQDAGGVVFLDPEEGPVLGALSLEAARLSLPQASNAPECVLGARRALLAEIEFTPPLRAALDAIADEPVLPA
ncbi:MAG: hypothetical protein ACK5MQ_06960 [Pikeienuella sp.]